MNAQGAYRRTVQLFNIRFCQKVYPTIWEALVKPDWRIEAEMAEDFAAFDKALGR